MLWNPMNWCLGEWDLLVTRLYYVLAIGSHLYFALGSYLNLFIGNSSSLVQGNFGYGQLSQAYPVWSQLTDSHH